MFQRGLFSARTASLGLAWWFCGPVQCEPMMSIDALSTGSDAIACVMPNCPPQQSSVPIVSSDSRPAASSRLRISFIQVTLYTPSLYPMPRLSTVRFLCFLSPCTQAIK